MVLRRKRNNPASTGANVPRRCLETPMKDDRAAELAGQQFNRVSRGQLAELGLSEEAIKVLGLVDG